MLPALVLTAGFGARLDPITRLVAKPAVPLAGRTLIERVLLWLGSHGVTDTVLNLHYRPASITSSVGDGVHLGLRVRYSWEQPILGSAGGPRHALPLLDADPFIIVNGDTLCDIDLRAMIGAHRASGARVTMAVVPNPAPEHYNGLVLDGYDRVTGVRPRGEDRESWHFVGVQIASASVFADLPDGVAAETVHGIYRALMDPATRAVQAWRVTAPFYDVGTPADYLAAALALGEGATIESGATVEPGARIMNSVVWPGAAVGEHAILDECIVTNVDVPSGFRARRSIIVPASVCRDGDRATMVGEIACFPLKR